MAEVVVAPAAVADLELLIAVLTLPDDTRARVKKRLYRLAAYPESGAPLGGRWDGFRFVLGPWTWMLIVYVFEPVEDKVSVVTIQDSRSAVAATGER